LLLVLAALIGYNTCYLLWSGRRALAAVWMRTARNHR